jgi:esterase/lipase superfamily enzyme
MTSRASRRSFSFGLASLAALGASGCFPDVMSVGSVGTRAVVPTPPGYNPEILAITNRRPAKGALKAPWYGHERNGRASLARVVFTRPDTTLVGRARASVSGTWSIETVQPDQRTLADGISEYASDRDVLLYIHGYKESFESSAISAVELTEGINFSGKTAVFSWPSKAALLDYGYDRESALISRDALEELLTHLLADGGATRVHIVAHSMGTLLTIETLRQMWARHGDTLSTRLGAIVLAAPDIDIDLFANAAERLRSIVPRMTVISSTADRALEVSRRLAGGVARAGAASRDQLEGLGVRVVDASDFGGWALIRHDLFLSDTDVRQVVRRSIERAR